MILIFDYSNELRFQREHYGKKIQTKHQNSDSKQQSLILGKKCVFIFI